MRQIFVLLFILFTTQTFAIEDRFLREIIVEVSDIKPSYEYLKAIFPQAKLSISSEMFHLVKLQFQDSIPYAQLNRLKSNRVILQFFKNKELNMRSTIPNDSSFNKQFHHQNNFNPGQSITYGINSINAWDFQKGATTANGDTIVVAVFDFGFEPHSDLDYFINRNEIPNDNIDNDNNGAIDDYMGWSVLYNNGTISGALNKHGIGASGGIAARGNNNKGVTGVAWNCKILPIVNNELTANIETAIKGIEYAIKMKKLYNLNNGTAGANIVVFNASFGGIGLNPLDTPEYLWCRIIDSLGKNGILYVSSVENSENPSESLGDMPTTCNSPYMINVTTYNQSTLGLDGSAYSKNIVHLAAPHNYYSTKPSNSYGLSGTGASFAAPIVSGTIALMYSNFDKKMLNAIAANPAESMSKIKQTIINQVDKTDLLSGKVVSDGKLNLFKVIKIASTIQDSSYGKASISYEKSNEVYVYSHDKIISVQNPNLLPLSISLYNMYGINLFNQTIRDPQSDIDCHHLSEGIYIATYQYGSYTKSLKLVIR